MNPDIRSVFLHERLEAYIAARALYRCARDIRERLPRGLGEVRDQLYRAASSVSLAIAEGANASQPKIRVRRGPRPDRGRAGRAGPPSRDGARRVASVYAAHARAAALTDSRSAAATAASIGARVHSTCWPQSHRPAASLDRTAVTRYGDPRQALSRGLGRKCSGSSEASLSKSCTCMCYSVVSPVSWLSTPKPNTRGLCWVRDMTRPMPS